MQRGPSVIETTVDLDSGIVGSWPWQGWASVVDCTCVPLFLGTQLVFVFQGFLELGVTMSLSCSQQNMSRNYIDRYIDIDTYVCIYTYVNKYKYIYINKTSGPDSEKPVTCILP